MSSLNQIRHLADFNHVCILYIATVYVYKYSGPEDQALICPLKGLLSCKLNKFKVPKVS